LCLKRRKIRIYAKVRFENGNGNGPKKLELTFGVDFTPELNEEINLVVEKRSSLT